MIGHDLRDMDALVDELIFGEKDRAASTRSSTNLQIIYESKRDAGDPLCVEAVELSKYYRPGRVRTRK